MSKELLNPIFTSLAVIIAAAIGAKASHYITKLQNRKESLLKMYSGCYAPIYHLLYEEITASYKKISGKRAFISKCDPVTIKPHEALSYKKKIISIIDENKSSCPSDLLHNTLDLTPDNFDQYCLFISDNYNKLQNKLTLISPKPKRSLTTRRILNIFYAVLGAAYMLTIVFAAIFYFRGNVTTAIIFYFAGSAFFIALIYFFDKIS